MMHIASQFSKRNDNLADAMAAVGIEPPEKIIADGRLHRFPSNGRHGDTAGWYVAHDDTTPSGVFGCWRLGFSRTWCSRNPADLSPAERVEQRRRIAEASRQRRAEQAEQRSRCRDRAEELLAEAQPADPSHPYLVAKAVGAHSILQSGDRLIIPVRSVAGAVRGVQFIGPDGSKRFMPGTEKAGGFHLIEGSGDCLIIAEGFATGASVHEATGATVAVAFDCHNLEAVALTLRHRFPLILIAGDNDESGIGQAKARAAATAAQGIAIIPPVVGDDWNDVARRNGKAAVEAAFRIGDSEALRFLADLSPLEYDRRRDAWAKRLGIRPATLDAEIKRLRPEPGADDAMAVIEPWADPVDGAELLDAMADKIARHLILPTCAADAISLWVLHAHAHDTATLSPILAITSPTPECGKTTLLSLLGALVPKPLSASNITVAPLFRAVEKWGPTLLVDEADTFLRDSDELRGVINSGHNKHQAYVIRAVGDEHEPTTFSRMLKKVLPSGSLA